jgi:glucosamine--fructose-6-phosphate aminotransferase (isomerizing)
MKVRKIKDDSLVNPTIQELQMNLEQIEGYDHFMLKEIYEQPSVIKILIAETQNEGLIQMAGVEDNLEKFLNADRIIIVACGTSWHAGLVAEYVFEEFARIPVEVEYASEFRYRNPIINKRYRYCYFSIWRNSRYYGCYKISQRTWHLCLVFVMLWVLQFLEKLRSLYACGSLKGVASTKAFTTQITVLTMIALRLAKAKGTIAW